MNNWNLDQSACILTGTEPDKLTPKAQEVKLKISAAGKAGEIIRVSVNNKKSFINKDVVIKWAMGKDIEIPNELKDYLQQKVQSNLAIEAS